MHRHAYTVLTALAVGLLPLRLDAQTQGDRVRVDVTGYAQFQFNTTSVDEEDLGSPDGEIAWSTFETRRIRPTVRVTIDDWISGVIQPDFALGRLSLKDAYMNLAFDDRAQLRIGQFKKAFSLIELTSSSRIVPIERGVRIRGMEGAFDASLEPGVPSPLPAFGGPLVGEHYELLDALGYVGRDIGVALHGELGRLAYEIGGFNGNGADERDDNDGKSAAARLAWRPLADRPLTIGGGASYRELLFSGDLDGRLVEDERLDGVAVELDAEWGGFRRPGLHLLLELATGENLAVDEPFLGAQGIASYFRPGGGRRVEGVEPLLRVSFGDPDTTGDDDRGWLITPGVNLYFFGRNRVMLNWDVFVSQFERFETQNALRAQAQLHF